MKSLILGMALFLSTQAFATGGFYCATPAKEFEMYGTTGRVIGNPLVGPLHVNTAEQVQDYPRTQVVGYWNMGDTLKFAIIDANAEKMLYKVEATAAPSEEMPTFVGVLTLASGEFFLVKCEAE